MIADGHARDDLSWRPPQRRRAVPQYRIEIVDPQGAITFGTTANFDTDAEACSLARLALGSGGRAEVRAGLRLVATVRGTVTPEVRPLRLAFAQRAHSSDAPAEH